MTRLTLAVPGRAARFSFFLFLTLALVSTAQAGGFASRSNTGGAGVDGDLIGRDITFLAGDFPAGATITNVDITVNFEKIDGGGVGAEAFACAQLGGAGHQGGSVWNNEIFMGLISPEGTGVVLVEDDISTGGFAGPTYTSTATYGGNVTVTFTENTGTLVGGSAPVSGTFLPVEFLGFFNGENPVGTWTLVLGDNFPADPLCSGTFTIAITTTGGGGGGGFTVDNSMTASFGDPAFNGQGINLEVLALPTVGKDGEKGAPGTVLMYWYTFDMFGFPIWAFGVGSIVGDTMVVAMFIDYDGNGPLFFPFNPSLFQALPFATATIIWATCADGTMTWVFDPSFLALGFVAYTMFPERITNVSGLPFCNS